MKLQKAGLQNCRIRACSQSCRSAIRILKFDGLLYRPRTRTGGERQRDQARLQAAGAAVSSGHQPGGPHGRGAVSPDRRSVRDAERSRSPEALRHGGADKRRRAGGRMASRDSISRSASAANRRRRSAICSPMSSASAEAQASGRRAGAGRGPSPGDWPDVRGSGSRRPARARRHAPGTLPQLQRSRSLARRGEPLRAVSWVRRVEIGARSHGVLEAVHDVRRHRTSAAGTVPDVRRAAGRNPHRNTDRQRAGGARRRRPHPRAGQRTCRPQRRRERRPVHLGPGAAASALPPGGRRPACRRAGGDSRGRARREDRGAVARWSGAAARPARHAVGSALPRPRARHTVEPEWPSRRSRGRSETRAAEAARRAIEGTAEGIRPDQFGDPRKA